MPLFGRKKKAKQEDEAYLSNMTPEAEPSRRILGEKNEGSAIDITKPKKKKHYLLIKILRKLLGRDKQEKEAAEAAAKAAEPVQVAPQPASEPEQKLEDVKPEVAKEAAPEVDFTIVEDVIKSETEETQVEEAKTTEDVKEEPKEEEPKPEETSEGDEKLVMDESIVSVGDPIEPEDKPEGEAEEPAAKTSEEAPQAEKQTSETSEETPSETEASEASAEVAGEETPEEPKPEEPAAEVKQEETLAEEPEEDTGKKGKKGKKKKEKKKKEKKPKDKKKGGGLFGFLKKKKKGEEVPEGEGDASSDSNVDAEIEAAVEEEMKGSKKKLIIIAAAVGVLAIVVGVVLFIFVIKPKFLDKPDDTTEPEVVCEEGDENCATASDTDVASGSDTATESDVEEIVYTHTDDVYTDDPWYDDSNWKYDEGIYEDFVKECNEEESVCTFKVEDSLNHATFTFEVTYSSELGKCDDFLCITSSKITKGTLRSVTITYPTGMEGDAYDASDYEMESQGIWDLLTRALFSDMNAKKVDFTSMCYNAKDAAMNAIMHQTTLEGITYNEMIIYVRACRYSGNYR